MRKIIIFLICAFFIETVSATEFIDFTDDVELKYRWYKNEIIDGFYHSKREKVDGYIEDVNNVQYGEYSDWDLKYCDYSPEEYLIEEKNITTYEKIANTRYLKMEFIKVDGEYCNDCVSEIKIFLDKNEIGYEILSQTSRQISIDLLQEYDTEKLWFFIDADHLYNMYLFKDRTTSNENLSVNVKRKKILIPNINWLKNTALFNKEKTDGFINEGIFIKNIETTKVCRVSEIKTYRYKIQKKYYDNNYYSYVDNYIPDITDYFVYYNGKKMFDYKEPDNLLCNSNYENINNENVIGNEIIVDNEFTEFDNNIDQEQLLEHCVCDEKVVKKYFSKKNLLFILIFLFFVVLIKLLKKIVD